MPINTLYHTWILRIRELRPKQRITQLRGFAWLLVGIFTSRSVSLSRIAGRIPGTAKLVSVTRRLNRLLKNPAIVVRDWYEPLAKEWIRCQAENGQQIRLIVDGSKVGFGHQLLTASLAYRRRAIPIAWIWVERVRGHSSASVQLELLRYVRGLLPGGMAVLLVGDSEFGPVAVLRQLDQWGWDYALRQKPFVKICLAQATKWYPLDHWVQKPGQSRWLGACYLAESEIYPVHVLLYWAVSEKNPWFLATNLPDRKLTLQAYRRRMWIEEMFGDLKRHGFDLESTMLQHADRLSRLTLAVILLYVWSVSTGARAIHEGRRPLVDRKERRDLSIFQIGLRLIERFLINNLFLHRPCLCSYL
jgi:hypothetical protein